MKTKETNLMNIAKSLLTRGSILSCCECGATTIVVHKNELPEGWVILVSDGWQFVDVKCPQHDPVYVPAADLSECAYE